MPGNDDDAVLLAGKFGDDVVDGKLAGRRVGGEVVELDAIALEFRQDVLLGLGVSRASRLAGADGNELLHMLKGAGGVDLGSRLGLSRPGCCGCRCGGLGRGGGPGLISACGLLLGFRLGAGNRGEQA